VKQEDEMRTHLIPTAILAILFLIASAANADDKGEAKKHFEKGKALQKSQEVDEQEQPLQPGQLLPGAGPSR
jgi:hypothetical protein